MYPRRKIIPVNLGPFYLYSSTVPVDGRPVLDECAWFCYGSVKERGGAMQTEWIQEDVQK